MPSYPKNSKKLLCIVLRILYSLLRKLGFPLNIWIWILIWWVIVTILINPKVLYYWKIVTRINTQIQIENSNFGWETNLCWKIYKDCTNFLCRVSFYRVWHPNCTPLYYYRGCNLGAAPCTHALTEIFFFKNLNTGSTMMILMELTNIRPVHPNQSMS